jgi:hypothetical protein
MDLATAVLPDARITACTVGLLSSANPLPLRSRGHWPIWPADRPVVRELVARFGRLRSYTLLLRHEARNERAVGPLRFVQAINRACQPRFGLLE